MKQTSLRIMYKFNHLFLILLSVSFGFCVELQFEHPDSGFFLRSNELPSVSDRAEFESGFSDESQEEETIMDVKKLMVLDLTRPALIRASYGPFSTKQTVPARYLLPEFPDEDKINVTASRSPFEVHSHHLEISAHLVLQEVTKSKPTVRVLVHGAGARGHHSPHICVTVLVNKDPDSISASCTPTGAGETGGDATCLVSIGIPSHWWPPHTRTTVKLPRTTVSVSYLVGTAQGQKECAERDAENLMGTQFGPRVTIQPETKIGEVALTLNSEGYKEISSDPLVHVMVPQIPLRPGTVIHAPLYLHPPGNLPALVFVIKCKVKGGIRISGVESANPAWNLTIQFKSRKSTAYVTALLSNPIPDNETLHTLGLHEVFSWVLEVPPDAIAATSKVTWALQYKMDANQQETFSVGGQRKMYAMLNILKDDIQAVLPIAKSWSVVNTAVLTGKQVSRAMKVLIVSEAGKIADVTLQSSCNCTDEAALKVSSSCTSVYLDGSEVRGSQNATVVARYGQRYGSASFTVWMPEFPLIVHLDDTKLFKIRGWLSPKFQQAANYGVKDSRRYLDTNFNICGTKYQQTPVQVYGRFVAVDDNSGRQSYLLSRHAKLRVTEIVTHLLRVADTSVASLVNTIVHGKSPGRTEVQVLSPITGRVIAAKEIRVGTDEVWVTHLHAKVISGLTLTLQPDLQNADEFTAITTVTPTLTAKYQEGLVDIWVEMSDGVLTPLREIQGDDYELKITSLEPDVVGVAPSPRTSQPRVIALGHGEGDILQISLEASKLCGLSQPSLATTITNVKVHLRPDVSSEVHFGDEHHTYPEGSNKRLDELHHLSELPIADAAIQNQHYALPDLSNSPAVQARMHPSETKTNALEVSMYTLLGIFGIVVIIFAGACVVYSGVGRGSISQLHRSSLSRSDSISQDSVTNAHDWVWLGKATLERASGIAVSPSGQSEAMVPLSDLNGNNNANKNNPWKEFSKFSKGYESSCLSGHMNIINNPSAELEPLLKDSDDILNESSTQIDSRTFIRPFSRTQLRAAFNKHNGNTSLLSAMEQRPPIPPHRNVGVNVNVGPKNFDRPAFRGAGPPPIPPHGVNVIPNPFENKETLPIGKMRRSNFHINNFQNPRIVQQQDDINDTSDEKDTEEIPKFIEVNADDFVRLRGVTRSRAAQVRRATIMENPLLSTSLPDNFNITDHMENLPQSMDYNQLLEYFSNLKESNA